MAPPLGQPVRVIAVCAAIAALFLLGAKIREMRGETPLAFIERSKFKHTDFVDGESLVSGLGAESAPASHTGSITAVAFSPDGRLVASASADHSVILWDVKAGRPVSQLTGHTARVTTVAFAPDGTLLVSGSEDASVRLWAPDSGDELWTFSGHTAGVQTVAFSPEGDHIASGAADGTMVILEVNSSSPVRTLSGNSSPVVEVAFSPDGRVLDAILVAGQQGDALWRWHWVEEQVLRKAEASAMLGRENLRGPVARSVDGRLLARAGGNEVTIIDIEKAGENVTFVGHAERITSLAFSPDGKMLASGSLDKSIVLWSLATHRANATLYGHYLQVGALAFSPNGRTLASSGPDRTLRIWNIDTGHSLLSLGDPIVGAETMWDLRVTGRRKRQGDLLTGQAEAGNVFIELEVDITNKLSVPNLFYMFGLRVVGWERSFSCVGIDNSVTPRRVRDLRFYKEPGSGSSHRFLFEVPKGLSEVKLIYLDAPGIEVSLQN